MKNVLALITLCLLLGACNGNQAQQEEVTEKSVEEAPAKEQVKLTGNFGEEIDEEGAVSTAVLVTKMEDKDSLQVKVSGEILASCKMKGCWMNIDVPGEDEMRVTFKDYSFFVPKEGVEGKTAIIEGYAKTVTTDVETQRHFAKDAGKPQEEIDAITEPKEELTFVATGVIIKDSE